MTHLSGSGGLMRQAVAARRINLVLVATMVVVFSLSTWLVRCANAYQLTDDLEIRGTYKMESYFRLPDGMRTVFNPGNETFSREHLDHLMSQRNEFRLDVEWSPKTESLGKHAPPIKVV